MEDDFDAGNSANPVDDEVSLPKATVYKLVTEMVPEGITASKDTKDLLVECCVEFIHLIASESNDVCEKEKKKTIGGEHVISALSKLGFESYVEELEKTLEETKKIHKAS